jgi:glycosyltransferase involved in cell wall biosynthesis
MTGAAPAGPLVSIIMPTYKRAHLLQGAIDSVLNQTFRDFELIVVDDNSPDETPDIVARIQDPRVRYVRNDPNLRLPRALNRGFSLARGRYLTWTSDDNFYAPTAIKRMVEALQNGSFGLVYADYYLFSEVDAAGRPTDLHHDRLPSTLQLEKGNHIGACFMYTREAYEAVGDYDPDLFLVEDYDYFIRIAKVFNATHLAEPLYYFRRDDVTLYLSRFAEVKASDVLVRYKNGLLDEDGLMNAMVELLTRDPSALKNHMLGMAYRAVRPRSWRLGRLLEALIRRNVRHALRAPVAKALSAYKRGTLSFPQTRDELRTAMQRVGTVEYRPAS